MPLRQDPAPSFMDPFFASGGGALQGEEGSIIIPFG